MKKQESTRPKFLADLNISPKTVEFLRGLDVDVYRIDKKNAEDIEVIKKAKEENRTIITFDKDFGEAYYFHEKGEVTIIVLYVKNQRYENINSILKKFILAAEISYIKNKLVILYEDRYRLIG